MLDRTQTMVHTAHFPVEDIWSHAENKEQNLWTITPGKWANDHGNYLDNMETLRLTVPANGHWKGLLLHGSARPTAFQNCHTHLGRTLTAWVTRGPGSRWGGCSLSSGPAMAGRMGMTSALTHPSPQAWAEDTESLGTTMTPIWPSPCIPPDQINSVNAT